MKRGNGRGSPLNWSTKSARNESNWRSDLGNCISSATPELSIWKRSSLCAPPVLSWRERQVNYEATTGNRKSISILWCIKGFVGGGGVFLFFCPIPIHEQQCKARRHTDLIMPCSCIRSVDCGTTMAVMRINYHSPPHLRKQHQLQ